MYLRKLRRKGRDGAVTISWALVESVRTERGPRQRVVSYLGEMPIEERLGVQDAAMKHPGVQMSIGEDVAPRWVEVDVSRVQVKRARRFGDVWLALELLKKMGLTDLLHDAPSSPHAKISWSDVAILLVIARFCNARSELEIAETFYGTTALDSLLGIPEGDVYDNRLYRALDKLIAQKASLERHLMRRFGELFGITFDLLLYDVTSTFFEGAAAHNPQAQRGYSRDGRPDCKQVCIGLVVTREGIPLGYEVFEGNRNDSRTVETIVAKMEAQYGVVDRVWVMDRGMAGEATRTLMNAGGRRYIIGTVKNQLRAFEQELLAKDWKEVRPGVEVKLCPSPEGKDEVFILCRSTARREKEKAMHDRFLVRLVAGLEKIKSSCDAGRIKSVAVAERRIGRLMQMNSRAASMVDAKTAVADGCVALTWTVHDEPTEWARLSEGCYMLRSNIRDWEPEELWRVYIQLTEAEAAFRVHKDDLNLRPIWHQRQDRVQAHILVCFLTYVLWKAFGQMCKRAGLGNEPRKVIEEIKALTLVDVVLQTRSGTPLTFRCISKPEKSLAELLHKLNLHPPERLTNRTDL